MASRWAAAGSCGLAGGWWGTALTGGRHAWGNSSALRRKSEKIARCVALTPSHRCAACAGSSGRQAAGLLALVANVAPAEVISQNEDEVGRLTRLYCRCLRPTAR
jgi:hypothetical protein